MTDQPPTLASLLLNWMDVQTRLHPGVPLLCVSGAQGIGKSTALNAVARKYADRVAMLSLDDFYLSASDRKALAAQIAQQFEVRGPPGTHDLALLNATIDALLAAEENQEVRIPRFDKRLDDRLGEREWSVFVGQPKAILMEGWCIGALPDPESPGTPPMNSVEAGDELGAWRAYQEDQLEGPYANLWDRVDAFLHLCSPGFEQVLTWRTQQEETTLGLSPGRLPDDRRAWVADFIQYYERVTRRMLDGGRRRGYSIQVAADRSVREDLSVAPDVLVFSDLDGTLLDHETYSFSAASEALAALRDRNALLVLSSSKTAAEMEILRAELGFEHCPAIVENGGGILEAHARSEGLASPLHANIQAILELAPPELRACFTGFSDWNASEVASRTGLPLETAHRAKQRQFSEPGLWTGTPEALQAFESYLEASGIFTQRGGRFLTLSHGKTKADQMLTIASRYFPAPTIALGDAPNDIEMIEAAHRGVIIKNASGSTIDRMPGEAIGRVFRTERHGPAGWNRAILEFMAELDARGFQKRTQIGG